MYVEERNFCGEEEEALDLGIVVLIFKHHNFLGESFGSKEKV